MASPQLLLTEVGLGSGCCWVDTGAQAPYPCPLTPRGEAGLGVVGVGASTEPPVMQPQQVSAGLLLLVGGGPGSPRPLAPAENGFSAALPPQAGPVGRPAEGKA